jgi:hypothetical protein
MTNTSIVACGQMFDIGRRVVLWNDLGGLNAYNTTPFSYTTEDRKTGKKQKVTISGKRYSSRSFNPRTLDRLQNVVSQFFLHHSGLYHSNATFNTLHNERGFSATFILDDDGTLYQTLDMQEKAWHGGKNNDMSIGIEIDSRADANKYALAYDIPHQQEYNVGPRNILIDNVQGMNKKGFCYNDAQYATLIALGSKLVEIFPIIAKNPDFPRTNSGTIIKSILPSPTKYVGFICHYHTSENKWDPVCFDHNRFLRGVNKLSGSPIKFDTWLARQNVLKTLGYNPGPIDGVFGPKTLNAIKAFQTDNGMSPDGDWGLAIESLIVRKLG